MKRFPKDNAQPFATSDKVSVSEYGLANPKFSAATASITGRHPLTGWMINKVSDELVYVVSGSGKLLSPDNELMLQPGDVALIEAGEKYAWEGNNLFAFTPCIPAWTPGQHELVEQ